MKIKFEKEFYETMDCLGRKINRLIKLLEISTAMDVTRTEISRELKNDFYDELKAGMKIGD